MSLGLLQGCTLTSPTNMLNVKEMIDWLTREQREVVCGCGFTGILELMPLTLDPQMLSWIINSFNTEIGCVSVEGHIVPVTASDVAACFGLPQGSRDICNGLRTTGISAAVEEQLHIPVTEGCIVYSEVHRSLQNLETCGTEFRVKFFVLLMYYLLCPGESDTFYREFALFVARAGELAEYDWSAFVFDKVVFGARTAQTLAVREVSGCVTFLVVSGTTYVGVMNYIPPWELLKHFPKEVVLKNLNKLGK